MANLFNFLTNEINKGNTLLDRKGNTVSIEKEVTKLRKVYVKEFTAGNIPVTVSFEDWAKGVIDSDYITLEFILEQLTPPTEEEPKGEDTPEELGKEYVSGGYIDTDMVGQPDPEPFEEDLPTEETITE